MTTIGRHRAFLKVQRKSGAYRMTSDRVQDYRDVALPVAESRLQPQASRCMDCGVPFCQSGTGCPIDNLIPEWNELVYRGLWKEALARLHQTNPFPDFTGRVCPAPCEGACVLGLTDSPVTIKNIERTIADRGFEKDWIQPRRVLLRTGKRVAVVGSGPAGLAAADRLNQLGHSVTVFERDDRVGGLLMYGIPPMKLEKNLVNRRVELLSREGVEFLSSVHVGVDVEAQRLNEENDALLLACGATRPRDLKAPGRHLGGIYFAMDFLRASTKSYLDSGLQNGDFISARGKKVLVIGGGDTGTDCIATAIRHGCLEVQNFELLPQPPDERAGDNPWPQWPRVLRADYGHKEACDQFGTDPRSFGILTKQFLGDSEGNVTGVRTVRVRWIPGDVGTKMMELPGTEQDWEADMVLLALGFLGPDETLVPGLGLETDSRSNFKAGFGSYTTNVPGVFAAGDCRRGQSLVVWAIREGLEAAEAIHSFVTQA